MKKCLAVALLSVALAACSTNKTDSRVPSVASKSAKLVGIWKMHPLRGGSANVVEFTHAGESRLFSHSCINKEQAAPEFGRYAVDPNVQTIQITTKETTQTLKILFVGDAFLLLSQNVAGQTLNFQYVRGSDLSPLCGSDALWAEKRNRQAPYRPSDFVSDPVIPSRLGIDRYVGRWANEKGVVQIEIQRLANGSYQLNHEMNENWTYLFNAAHWRGDELRYTSFAYSTRETLFDHPFHKSSHESFLVPLPNGDSMKHGFFINGQKYEYILNRK